MWERLLDWFLERFDEVSTYVALFNFLAMLGVVINPQLQTLITNLCLAIDALVLFFINEHKTENEVLKCQLEESQERCRRLSEQLRAVEAELNSVYNPNKTVPSVKKGVKYK